MNNDPGVNIMRSQLARARGLGSAKSGVHHWWLQRVTSIALLPLSLYFLVSIIVMGHASRLEVAAFMGEPWNTVLYLWLIGAMFYHLLLGMQVVIEDYVRGEPTRLLTMLATKAVIVFCGLACAVSVLKLAF